MPAMCRAGESAIMERLWIVRGEKCQKSSSCSEEVINGALHRWRQQAVRKALQRKANMKAKALWLTEDREPS